MKVIERILCSILVEMISYFSRLPVVYFVFLAICVSVNGALIAKEIWMALIPAILTEVIISGFLWQIFRIKI